MLWSQFSANFFPIFGEEIGVFLKIQCYDQILAKTRIVGAKNANIFAKIFGKYIFKIITSGPGRKYFEIFKV
jgi:hypothetical protein